MAHTLVALALAGLARAEVTLNSLFTDGAILQSRTQYGARAFLYGGARPGETVVVTGLASPLSAVADASGAWRAQLTPTPASEDAYFNLTASGEQPGDAVTVRDVRFGDVFFCAGQSNMVEPVAYAADADAQLAAADATARSISLFAVDTSAAPGGSAAPLADFPVPGRWAPSARAAVANFSAVCYTAAKEMLARGGVRPIGLVWAAVGATCIESWSPPDALAACGGGVASEPNATLFNAYVHPAVGFALRGAWWYQGECNAQLGAAAAARYGCQLEQMIAAWRSRWAMGDFAFGVVQLAPLPGAAGGHDFPPIRAAQAAALPRPGGATDITALAVTLDLGDAAGGIHPHNKSEVGRRLALATLHAGLGAQTNASSAFEWTGPRAAGASAAAAAADGAVELAVAFDHADGLARAPTHDCSLCCDDPNDVEISLDGGATWAGAVDVRVDGAYLRARTAGGAAATAGATAAIRTQWSNFPECVLVNARGLPASPVLANATLERSADDARGTERAPRPRGGARASFATPPMGYNSWNFYHCNIDEHAIKETAQALIDTGLRDKGYEYVNIDDCWQVGREPNGTIVVDPARFPSGMRAVADWLHARALRFGVYTSATASTCQGRPGSYEYEAVDAAAYCDWGVDYLKIDRCSGASWPEANTSWLRFREGFDACLNATGRPIFESVEYCKPGNECAEWIGDVADAWRTSADINANWASVLLNADAAQAMHAVAGPGRGWNDPDMLEVGNAGLTATEARSHFSLWCMLSAPLLIATDVVRATNETLAILGNERLIALDQDALGFPGRLVNESDSAVWYKQLANGDVALLLINRADDDAAVSLTVAFAAVDGLSAGIDYGVLDLWDSGYGGNYTDSFTASIEPHDVVVLRVLASQVK